MKDKGEIQKILDMGAEAFIQKFDISPADLAQKVKEEEILCGQMIKVFPVLQIPYKGRYRIGAGHLQGYHRGIEGKDMGGERIGKGKYVYL